MQYFKGASVNNHTQCTDDNKGPPRLSRGESCTSEIRSVLSPSNGRFSSFPMTSLSLLSTGTWDKSRRSRPTSRRKGSRVH